MIGGNPYFLQNHHQQQQQQLFPHALVDGMDGGGGGGFMDQPPPPPPPPPVVLSDSADARCHALLYNLSVLKEKVQQLQPLVGLAVEHDGPGPVAAASGVIQEIISAASSMMYAFQQLCSRHQGAAASSSTAAQGQQGNHNTTIAVGYARNGETAAFGDHQQAANIGHAMEQQWQHHRGGGGGGGYDNRSIQSTSSKTAATVVVAAAVPLQEEPTMAATGTIIELDAAELLAKFTHYCQVCGKGFKRDANLRMHMRAHGDEYKSSAALANPAKAAAAGGAAAASTTAAASISKSYYSCPHEGCRWNRKHAKFQPLKSVICAKNHYKRSHCPKMYVCNRCNRKHFSVLSDLRTHEKHCGDHRWLCSCGTSFSRKDKLIGHLTLFTGHQPAVPLDRLLAAGGQPAANGSTAGIRRSSSSSSTTHHRFGTSS
ncbi:hypothetical protein U9M48_037774 [Paspalum notatum var. saurae]|uniref:C2H2-type domain-containing protein n=1 Tax=Paspalum notatum var. saurae TaxID=547442 RepID=A0AAQ3UHV0_PASNO